MKFQNPSLNFFLNGRKDERTDARTHKPKPICSPLFQSWVHKNLVQIGTIVSEKIRYEFLYVHNLGPRCGGHLGHVTIIMSADFHFLVPESFH